MKNYSEKLRDPRWQKKRLEILNRDNFTCRVCNDSKTELHIHHNKYYNNPWDIDDIYLVTLCKHCHELIEGTFKGQDSRDFIGHKIWCSSNGVSIPAFLLYLNKKEKDVCIQSLYEYPHIIFPDNMGKIISTFQEWSKDEYHPFNYELAKEMQLK